MPTDATEKTEVETPKKRKGPVRRATLADLKNKPRQEREVPYVINGDEMSFLFRAISARDYDRLATSCPPNIDQRAAGASFNINEFAPKLLARVVIEPAIDEDTWGEFWTSPDWNRGELMSLFGEAVEICSTGLRLGPTATA